MLLRNSAPGVNHADPDTVGTLACLQGERAAFGHGLQGVLDEVDQDLLDLHRIDRGDGQLARKTGAYVHVTVVDLRFEQLEGFLDHVVERSGFNLRY